MTKVACADGAAVRFGYRFCGGAPGVARKTFARMTETAARLYEQKGRRDDPTPLGRYLTRWFAWFTGGLAGLDLRSPTLAPLLPPHSRQGREARQDESHTRR
jgi:hypothetical protein